MRPFAGLVHGVEVVPDGDARQENQAGDNPGILRTKRQRVVVRQHQKHDRQGEVVVVRRPHLGNLAVFRIRRAASLKVFDHDPLVWHDLKEHVGGHDGGCESTKV